MSFSRSGSVPQNTHVTLVAIAWEGIEYDMNGVELYWRLCSVVWVGAATKLGNGLWFRGSVVRTIMNEPLAVKLLWNLWTSFLKPKPILYLKPSFHLWFTTRMVSARWFVRCGSILMVRTTMNEPP